MTRCLTVPYPPSVNHYWRRVGSRTLISKRGRDFCKEVVEVARTHDPLEGPLRMFITIHPPDRRRRDVDNVLKALLDALQKAGVYQDDSQIVVLAIRKSNVVPGGRCFVSIGERR